MCLKGKQVMGKDAKENSNTSGESAHAEKAGHPPKKSGNVAGSIRETFGDTVGGMEYSIKIGTVLSYLAGAIGTWWLGGQNLWVSAIAGLATAWALPQIASFVSRTTAEQVTPQASTVAVDDGKTIGGPDRTQSHSVATPSPSLLEVNEAGLGGLSLSELLPRGKSGDRRRV
jgi:hypothetical protein